MSCSLLNCFLELDRLVDCLYCWLWCYGLFHCRLGSSCYRLLWLIVHFRLVVNLAGLSVECYDCWLILLDRRRSLRFHCFVLGRLHRKWHPEWLIILKMILLIFFFNYFWKFFNLQVFIVSSSLANVESESTTYRLSMLSFNWLFTPFGSRSIAHDMYIKDKWTFFSFLCVFKIQKLKFNKTLIYWLKMDF